MEVVQEKKTPHPNVLITEVSTKSAGSPRALSLTKKLLATRKDDSSDTASQFEDTAKRHSILPLSVRPSISAGSGSRLSIVGLMASRRFAKKLAGRALEKRESTLGEGPPPVLYEPTYRLEPKFKFQDGTIKEIIIDVIDTRLRDMKYNCRIAPNLNRILADEVKDRVKKLGLERFKLLVVVMIGEKKGQGVMVSSRCSWDDKRDSYVAHTFQNKHIFCSCSVYGVYKE